MSRDPVCGREVDALRARAVGIWNGRTYYFCSPEHRAAFANDPAAYREERAAPAAAPASPPARKATPSPMPVPRASAASVDATPTEPQQAPLEATARRDTPPEPLVREDSSPVTVPTRNRAWMIVAVLAALATIAIVIGLLLSN